MDDLDYNRRLFSISNSYVSATCKLVMWAVRRYILILWDKSNAVDQLVEVNIRELAAITGLSTDALGKSIKALHQVGLLLREEKKERLKDGSIRTHVFVALTMLSYYPETIRLDDGKKRNHGGDRRYCRYCGSDDLVKVTRVVCQCCNRQQEDEEVTPVNAPDPLDMPATPAPDPLDVPVTSVPDPLDQAVPFVDDDVTEKRPVVRFAPPSPDRRPPKPLVPCMHCRVVKWIWYEAGKEYVCVDCYSPAPKQEERGIGWTPF